MHFLKKLDSGTVEKIKDRNPEAVWFTDLGSGLFHKLADLSGVITDHHLPSEVVVSKGEEKDLRAYTTPEMVHVNPHLVGIDGTSELSSSGTAYLVARALSRKNEDLAALGVVGAVGDMQDRAQGLHHKGNLSSDEVGHTLHDCLIQAPVDGMVLLRQPSEGLEAHALLLRPFAEEIAGRDHLRVPSAGQLLGHRGLPGTRESPDDQNGGHGEFLYPSPSATNLRRNEMYFKIRESTRLMGIVMTM